MVQAETGREDSGVLLELYENEILFISFCLVTLFSTLIFPLLCAVKSPAFSNDHMHYFPSLTNIFSSEH